MDWLFDLIFGTLTREQRLFIMRASWVGLVSFHMLWVCGYLTAFGLAAPFANAASLEKLTSLVMEDRIDRLQREILDTKARYCRATDPDTRKVYNDLINDLWEKYRRLADKDPHLPPCSDP